MKLENKVKAFYIKMLADRRGPVDRMVLDPIIKEYEKYFEINVKKS